MNPPDRGDDFLVDLGLVAKIRPCLVVSVPAEITDRALVTLVPHTTSTRGTRFEVSVQAGFLKPGAFDVQNLITIAHAKLGRRLGKLMPAQMSAVEDALKSWLHLA